MSVVDIILGALILFGLVRGFIKGLFVEIASILALVAGVYGAIHFSNFAAVFLENKTDWNEKTITITAFSITFTVIVIAIAFAGKALTKLANFAALGIINKFLGGVFGALKIALILSVLLNIFDKMNNTITFLDDQSKDASILYQPIKRLIPTISPKILHLEMNEDDKENEENMFHSI